MATNEILRDADYLSLPVDEGVKSGDFVQVGSLHGVAQTDRGAGGNIPTHATVWLDGAHALTVTASSTPEVGAPVYYESGALADTGTTIVGHVIPAADGTGPIDNSDGTFTVTVRLAN